MQWVMEGVSKQVAGQTWLHSLDLSLRAGGVTVLLGATEAGKTSLMRIMAGLDQPSAGRVRVDGADVTGVRIFVGTEWFAFVLRDAELHAALWRQIQFSLAVLAVEVPLVALLCFATLRAIPDAYYQASRIDGASGWAVFRYIQLPKMRGVLLIAVLLRFMDSFMIYTEPFVLTGGGPGNAATFLSQYLRKV